MQTEDQNNTPPSHDQPLVRVAHAKCKVYHTHLGERKTRVSYAWRDEGTTHIRYAASFTAPQDAFCRRLGAIRAKGRLNSDRLSFTIPKMEGVGIHHLIQSHILAELPKYWESVEWED